MPDIARFLPLSQRSGGDESAVPSDRREQLAAVVELAALHLPADVADPSARIEFVRAAGLTGDAAATDPDDLAAVSAAVRAGRRRGIRELTMAARAYLASPAASRAPLPADVSGGVALYASVSAPHDRRAAIAGHTVRAVDAEWSFGRGPEIIATADAIVAFLTGLSDIPPRRPAVS